MPRTGGRGRPAKAGVWESGEERAFCRRTRLGLACIKDAREEEVVGLRGGGEVYTSMTSGSHGESKPVPV